MPRDPLLGLFQSALDNQLSRVLPVEEKQMLDDRRTGPIPVVTDRRLAGVDLRLTPEGRRIFGRKEVTHPKVLSDPRWARSLLSITKGKIRGRAKFVDRPAEPPRLSDNARIILFGDWGSGLPRARRVADRIKEQLNDRTAERRQKHVIHLGDVYYGGEKGEYLENLLEPWPVVPGMHDVASYTLNGNHDMFPGGHACYGTALADPRFAAQHGSSMFALANDHWQFLGLDTAYEDGGLHGEQAEWIRRMRREHPRRKTVLLSHHQLFSAYEAGAATLRRKIRPVLEEKEIDAWFWGHEHRCLAYRDRERVRFASCVGHGGLPEYLIKERPVPAEGLEYEYRKVHGTGWQPWVTFGFAVLDLDGPRIHVRYLDEDAKDGIEHWATDLP
jgi:predicted phosphodiesterase